MLIQDVESNAFLYLIEKKWWTSVIYEKKLNKTDPERFQCIFEGSGGEITSKAKQLWAKPLVAAAVWYFAMLTKNTFKRCIREELIKVSFYFMLGIWDLRDL